MSTILIETAYFPPISYISALMKYDKICIEAWENFGRQSYRSRAEILSANGRLSLNLPVIKASRTKTLIKDVLIDYSMDWQKIHFKGIESAYRQSPFYEYYIDEIEVFFSRKYKYLIELNNDILNTVFKILEVNRPISLSQDYEKECCVISDYRGVFHPKKDFDISSLIPYWQTFGDKFGFIPNLSILDLIFNEGNNAMSYI